MQFNSHASQFDIVSDIDFWAGSDSDSYPIADKTRNVNLGYDHVAALIFQADGHWVWDDNNQTDMPIGKANLVENQQDYGINSAHLKILRVAIEDSAGNFYYLEPMSQHELRDRELMDPNLTAGTPRKYCKIGNSIILDRKPNYSATLGFKVYFQRNISYFITTDTAKTPGFAEPFHRLLSLYAAKDYCAVNDLSRRLVAIEKEILRLETALVAFYAKRSRDERPHLGLRHEDYGQGELGGGFGGGERSVNFQ